MTESVAVPPDWYTRPDYTETLGPEVFELCDRAGYTPYPEQAMLLDDIFAIDPNDSSKSAAFATGVIAARQQLKTGLLKQAALGWLFVERVPLVVWSSHEFSTTLEAQQDLVSIIYGSSDLAREVEDVKLSSTDHSIILKSGARILFKARTSGGGRGLTGDKVILDEAYALQPMHLGSLLPTLIQVPDPQILYGSSAGLLKSNVLRGIRDRGRVGDDRLVYAEWGSDKKECASEACTHRPGADGCALDDRELWAKACFVSFRKDPEMEVIASLRAELPPEEFARELLVWWDDPVGDGAFNLDRWGELELERQAPDEPMFAIDVSPGQDWAAIVAAGLVYDTAGVERHLVEVTSRDGVFDHRPGIGWVRDRVTQIREKFPTAQFVYAAGGGLESLVPDLEEDGVPLVRLPRSEVAAACGYLFELFKSGRLAHPQQDDLTDAVRTARQKQIGDSAFVWIRDGLADLAPLYAACLAVWQVNAGKDPAANVW